MASRYSAEDLARVFHRWTHPARDGVRVEVWTTPAGLAWVPVNVAWFSESGSLNDLKTMALDQMAGATA